MLPVTSQLALVGKGVLIGCAELIPSVSGGTIALLTGVWSRAVMSLAHFGWGSVIMLGRGEFRRFWREHNMAFLMLIFFGSLIGLFALARFVHWILEHQPNALMSVIVGVIIGSTPLMLRSLGPGALGRYWPFVLAGIFFGVALGLLPTGELEGTIALIFVSAMFASCAALLPGLSGAYILLVIGVYDEAVRAVNEFDVKILLTLFAGVVCGLLVFSRVVRRLLVSRANATLALMMGLVLGSLWKVFPSEVSLTELWGLAEAPDLGLPLGTCLLLMLVGAGAGMLLGRGAENLKVSWA